MAKAWNDNTVRYLLDHGRCPRCDAMLQSAGICGYCGADLSGPVAAELFEASARVAEALVFRQAIIDRLPLRPAAPTPSATPDVMPHLAPNPGVVAPAGSSSQVSVQSVLAIAGAGLLGVAAIVFTFLNPDLTNFATRTAIVALITLVFLGGAWLLARRRLQFSAEAIGALGVVFLILDIWALGQVAPAQISGWVFAGVGTLIGSVVMVAMAAVARIRSWLWAGLVGVTLTPALFGYALGTPLAATLGHLAVGFAALVAQRIVRRSSDRFASPLKADRVTAMVVQIMVTAVVLVQALLLQTPTALVQAALVAALAVLAALAARFAVPHFWSLLSGALVVTAVGVLPLALRLEDGGWYLGLVPLAAGIALAALATAGAWMSAGTIRPLPLVIGGWAVALVTALPVTAVTVSQLLLPIARFVPATVGLGAIIGLLAVALATAVLSRFTRPLALGALVTALSIGMMALLAIASWGALLVDVRVTVGLVAAFGLTALLVRVRPVASSPVVVRAPLIVGAHLLLLFAAASAWSEPTLSIIGGAVVVALLVVVAQTLPRPARPVHVGVAFAYALIVVATALGRAHLDIIAVLCLTTSLASLCALAATLIHRLTARFWYATLIVTTIPFLIGIVSVLMVRSGWTALSTAVTFALALTLVITRRPGLNRVVRAAASALLVPALAVVVICLGAQLFAVSGSPITLPIIAVIVAVTLPSTERIGGALVRRGLPDADARVARVWIEISSLVTAAIAVLLALVRAAAGLGTSFLVLIIIGLGAAAAGLITRRRYAWVVAAAGFTGALWCALALGGVDVLEPYILPPAIGAAVIGAVLVTRGLPGVWFYCVGLASAVAPSLAIVAMSGSGSDGVGLWRTYALFCAAAVLIAGAWIIGRRPAASALGRLATLRVATLWVAIGAAVGGVLQAIRYGWALDPDGPTDPQLAMLPVLGLSLVAVLLAAAAARLLATVSPSRWLYAPAVLYLVLGPMTAIRLAWFPILTLWALAAIVLALMLVTANRARTRAVTLPPVWFLFALAWVTAVVGWSERALRVETFSLPLGLALLAAGVIAMRADATVVQPPRAGFTSWPVGFTGSWRLLMPGIVVTLLPSVLSTATDPLTWRAILVIALALAAILIGSLRKLGAPFILGIVVLPVENIIVFVVQIGRSIGAAPWWITLATAGAVLLVIAVTYERRTTGVRGVAARLRDLQ